MSKRLFDLALSFALLAVISPVLLLSLLAVYLQDFSWPLYSPPRIGKNGAVFKMHKLRTMIVGADRNRVDTTALGDARITALGHFLRRYKLDELPQLWNILCGEMSLVGPRPQIEREVRLYTEAEKRLLSARPGITDFASIVFSDLGEIMAAHPDPNIAYNQLVRPWKSRLGLFYIDHVSVTLDLALIGLTAVAIVSRPCALSGVVWLLRRYHAPEELIAVCRREQPLVPTPPPGSDRIVTSREA